MSSEQSRIYYPALDGIRGLAIILVVLFHCFNFTKHFFFGWLGVDLFFVLSGFLITSILLQTVNQKNYFRNFLLSRALRIFPLYYLILFIFLIVFPVFKFQDTELGFYLNHQIWFWFYLQNWLLSFKLNEDYSFLNHLWSLAVEEQFYLIWPIVIFIIRKLQYLLLISFLLLSIVIAARCILWVNYDPVLNYTTVYTFTRIDGICIGSILAIVIKMKPSFIKQFMWIIVLILAILNFGFYFLNEMSEQNFPYYAFIGYTTFAALFGLLVHEAISNNKVVNNIFKNRTLMYFGKISYGLYLFHWPIYIMLFPIFVTYLNESSLDKTLIILISSSISVAIAIVLSTLSFNSFERYFLDLKKKIITNQIKKLDNPNF